MRTNVLETFPLRFIDMVEGFGDIWFSTSNFNGLFKGNLEEGTVEYLGMFPDLSIFQEATMREILLYSMAAVYQNELFFVPRYSKSIVAYHISDKHFETYEVPGWTENVLPCGAKAGQYKNFLFLWNSDNTNVFRFDMEKKEFTEVSEESGAWDYKYSESGKRVRFWRDFCIVGHSIYIISIERPAIMRIDAEKNVKKYFLLENENRIRSICFAQDRFWLTDIDNQMIEWWPGEKLVRHKIDDNIPIKDVCLSAVLSNDIYYVLGERASILVFHLKDQSFDCIDMCGSELEVKSGGIEGIAMSSLLLKVMDDKVWLLNERNSQLQYIERGKLYNKKLTLTENVGQFIYDRKRLHFANNCIMREGEVELEGFVYFIANKYRVENIASVARYDNGKQIYYKTK